MTTAQRKISKPQFWIFTTSALVMFALAAGAMFVINHVADADRVIAADYNATIVSASLR